MPAEPAQVNSDQWTLMHRFNKASDLIEAATRGYLQGDLTDHMAKIFVWLRYSANRQLTWQRNYNTQPRILSGAQKRLTGVIMTAIQELEGRAPEGQVRVLQVP